MTGILRLFAYLVIGELLVHATGLPVPGALIGLCLLLLDFRVCGGPDAEISAIFDRVAPHLPILFLPAGVGIIANLDLLGRSLLPIALAVTAGTMVTMVVTALLGQLVLRAAGKGATGGGIWNAR